MGTTPENTPTWTGETTCSSFGTTHFNKTSHGNQFAIPYWPHVQSRLATRIDANQDDSFSDDGMSDGARDYEEMMADFDRKENDDGM